MAKKRFGISSDVHRGLTEVIQIQEDHQPVYHNTVVPITKVLLDPNNPRKHAITLADLPDGPDKADSQFEQKMREFENLKELSDSIKAEGLIHPIIVYKEDENYRVVAGERRFLSSIIAGKQSIEARNFQKKPRGYSLRLVQWLENESREDLPLLNRIENIKMLVEAYKKEEKASKITAIELAKLTHMSRQTAQYYFAILKNEYVLAAIREGKVNSFKVARNLTKASSALDLDELLVFSKQDKISKAPKVKKEVKDTKRNGAGRKRSKVSLGYTARTFVPKTIVNCVLSAKNFQEYRHFFEGVNWDSFDESTQAFSKLIKLIEERGASL